MQTTCGKIHIVRRLQGIIFDKDGTLFDYYTVWAPVFRKNVQYILTEFSREDDRLLEQRMLHLLGIGSDGIRADGLIFKHNGTRMLFELFIFAKRNRIPYRRLIEGLRKGYYDSRELIKKSLLSQPEDPLLVTLFERLKDSGYAVGIVTSDNEESTRICLEHLGLTDYIDTIFTYDDAVRKKPNPQSFHLFCTTHGLLPDQVVVVGDAPVDMEYARRGKAGYRIAVLTGSGDVKRLERHADVIYPTVHELLSDPLLQLDPGTGGAG